MPNQKPKVKIGKPKITSEVGVSHPRRFNLKEYISGFYSAIFLVIFCFLFSSSCFAQVVINEFSSDNGSDWVEIYNGLDQCTDLSQYSLFDTHGNSKSLSCNLSSKSFYSIDWDAKLNKDGDSIFLKKDNNVIDCVSFGDGDGSFCLEQTEHNLEKLKPGEYGRRDPEGTGSWIISAVNSKSDNSQCITPSPSPSPSPSPKPSPSPSAKTSPSPSSSRLPSSSPVVSSSPSPEPIVKTSPQPQKEAKEATKEANNFTGEVFGATESSDEATKSAEETKSETNSAGKAKLPLIISLIGLVLLLISAFPLLKPQLTNLIDKLKNH